MTTREAQQIIRLAKTNDLQDLSSEVVDANWRILKDRVINAYGRVAKYADELEEEERASFT